MDTKSTAVVMSNIGTRKVRSNTERGAGFLGTDPRNSWNAPEF